METQPVLVLQPGIYHSYLVRIWREEPEMPWRASAQCVQTGETHRFATVEALFAFLTEQTGEQGAGGTGQGAGGTGQGAGGTGQGAGGTGQGAGGTEQGFLEAQKGEGE